MSEAHDSDQTSEHGGVDAAGSEHGAAVITHEQARIIGSMLEKERTTPADYPMTTNAIMRACNQSTSRNPVVSYDERTITDALVEMKATGLVRFVHSQSNRSTKYRQVVDEAWALTAPEVAALCLLLLRGPQTPGEIRTRSERVHPFGSPEAVETALTSLAARAPAMTVELERQPGQKERRWVQLLTGRPSEADLAAMESSPGRSSSRTPAIDEALTRRVGELESQVALLRAALEELVGPIDAAGGGTAL